MGVTMTIEQQLKQALESHDEMEHELKVAQNWASHHADHASELIAENARLREALENVAKTLCIDWENAPDIVTAVRKLNREHRQLRKVWAETCDSDA